MTSTPAPDLMVDVPGGRLGVHRLAAGPGTPVIAVHGITANALSFGAIARELDGVADLLAPDLRGRACSREVGPPFGLEQHASDVWAVADAAGHDRVILLGHSMGGFVAAEAAARHPDRVQRLVLADGGLPIPVPRLVRRLPDQVLLRVSLGKALARLGKVFDSPESYVTYWQTHRAVGPLLRGDDPAVAGYLRHDLVREGDGWRSSCVREAVSTDGLQVLSAPDVALEVAASGVPVRFLWSPRGMRNERRGLYRPRSLRRFDGPLTISEVNGSNHYSMLFAPYAGQLAAALSG